MLLLSAAVTHCRFEASDTAADEVVLLRILRLMELMIVRPEGSLLGDESICEMMSTGLSMCCQVRLTEVLRRSAEMAMITMCQIVFSRLESLDIEEISVANPVRSRSNTLLASDSEQFKIKPPMDGSVMGNGTDPRPSVDDRPSYDTASSTERREASASGPTQQTMEQEEEQDEPPTPFALPSVRELFRVLIDLLDSNNKQHTTAMRIMALRIIDVALEVSGPFIAAQPTMAVLVEDDLCRHLFQLTRTDDMVLLNSSLRVAGTLLTTCRKVLKLQQELFLSYLVACLHPKVEIPPEAGIDPSLYEGVPQAPKLVKPAPSQPSSGRSTPVPVKDRRQLGLEGGQRRPEAREAMVETIGTMIRMPGFMSELYLNYDCDIDRQDLCEDVIGLLARNAFPDAALWSTTNVPPLCLDSLLTFVQSLAERVDQKASTMASIRVSELQQQRTRKKIIKTGATKFNDKPKAGIAFLASNGIIANPDDPMQIARFLKSTTHISKKVLGEFLTKKDNPGLLKAFIELFDFDGKRIDEALRELLTSFRLPGESQLIERIVDVFVSKYITSTVPEGVADKDAGYVLTYAIIMLNTDLYNPNIKKTQKRMTVEDFARNLRGCNAGHDFDPEYLNEIYDAISTNEIILPDEHDNKNALDHAWKSMLMKTSDAGQLEFIDDNTLDAEIFRATWKPIVATLCYVFLSASDDAVFSRIVVGFDQCALLAAKYDIAEAFDRIVYSLSQLSTLAAETPPSTALNTEVQVGKRKIMVSELAVRLGRDFRAQLSTVLLFRTLNGHEAAVGDTWVYIVRILRNLFVNALVTLPVQETDKLVGLDAIALQPPSQVIDKDGKGGESGLFSTFTSYISSYAADDPPEPSEEELENTLSTVDCVKACKVDQVLANLLFLPTMQVERLVNALLSEIPDAPTPVVVVKPDIVPTPVTTRMNGTRRRQGPEYDPGSIFMLELATRLVLRDENTIASCGEVLTNSLESSIRDVSNSHPLAITRSVHYILTMLRHSSTQDFTRAPVVLHALSSFPDSVLDQTAPAITSGLTPCIAQPSPLRNDITSSPDFWSLLQRLHQHKSETEAVFNALVTLTSNIQPSTTAALSTYYESAISLASSFATAGSVGATAEQRRDVALRRGQKPKSPDAQVVAIVQRALQALSIILELSSHAQTLITQSHLDRAEAWSAYFSPVFRTLVAQCMNPCREIRHRALGALQRVLLSPDLVHEADEQAGDEWTAIYIEVLFPLVAKLLKPETHRLDAVGMGETRALIVGVLSRTFLKYFEALARIDKKNLGPTQKDDAAQTQTKSQPNRGDAALPTDTTSATSPSTPGSQIDTQSLPTQEPLYFLPIIWSRTLELLDRLLQAARATKESEALEEAVAESIKNSLLVLADTGYLVRPSANLTLSSRGDNHNNYYKNDDGDGDIDNRDKDRILDSQARMRLWLVTRQRLDGFLPGLLDELFSAPVPTSSSQSTTTPQDSEKTSVRSELNTIRTVPVNAETAESQV